MLMNQTTFELARKSDKLGMYLINIQDHPYNCSFFDTRTLITALAMSTRHIHFMTNVAANKLQTLPI